jgi:RNA polymerase sigma-70 factor (ECF subfamily)
VRKALESIPEAQREVLRLAYFDGLSQREIAERLTRPLGTVKTHTRLGLLKLRELLGEGDER